MTDKQQPPAAPERVSKQNEKDYLLRHGWMYTGPSPHRWTDPIDKQVYSRAEALRIQQQRKPIREYGTSNPVDDSSVELPFRVSACPRCGQPPMRTLITANRIRFYCPHCPNVPASEGETFEEVAQQWNDPGWRWDAHLVDCYARVHPADDTRMGEIRERASQAKDAIILSAVIYAEDVNYLLALLPQLSSSEPRLKDGGAEDGQLAGRLRSLLLNAFITGHSHGPSADYQVQLKFKTLQESQQCHTLIEALAYPEYRESFIKQGVLAPFATAPTESSERRCRECHHEADECLAGYCTAMVNLDGLPHQCGCKCVFPASAEPAGERVVLVRREDAARAAELVNDSIKAKGKFAAAILMMPPYPTPDCPICGYAIDNEGLCVLDAAHTASAPPVAQPEVNPVDNQAAIELLDKWLAEHPHVEHDEFSERCRQMINENSLSDRERCSSTTAPATAAESPILAYERWLLRWVADNGRKLTQTEYGIAYAAFIAAHPGKGPQSHTMSATEAVEAREIVIAWLKEWCEPDQIDEQVDIRLVNRIATALSRYFPVAEQAAEPEDQPNE